MGRAWIIAWCFVLAVGVSEVRADPGNAPLTLSPAPDARVAACIRSGDDACLRRAMERRARHCDALWERLTRMRAAEGQRPGRRLETVYRERCAGHADRRAARRWLERLRSRRAPR